MSIAKIQDPELRARRYLQLAEQAAGFSRSFQRPDMREACLNIARSWIHLAVQTSPAAPLGTVAWLARKKASRDA
jgi:hypothetical protein